MRQIHILHANFDTETAKFINLTTETDSARSSSRREEALSEESENGSSLEDGVENEQNGDILAFSNEDDLNGVAQPISLGDQR